MNSTPEAPKATPTQRRVGLGPAFPEAYKALDELSDLAQDKALSLGIPMTTIELVKLRASQINNCAYCLRIHVHRALEAGESTDRLAVLSAWDETELFDEKEQAAIKLAESITLVAEDAVPDELYAEVAEVLSKEEIAVLSWIAIIINSFNRLSVASRNPVRPKK